MVTFLIIRHGFSQGNKEKRFTGQLDVPLDEAGISQAKSVARYISENYRVDRIYASDLSRAYNTVKPLADTLGLPVIPHKGLREVHEGIWQGLRVQDIEAQYAEYFSLYKTNRGKYPIEGGESYQQVMDRAILTMDEIARENEGKTVVVGSHGGWIRCLCGAWLSVPVERIDEVSLTANGSLTVVNYENGKAKFVQIGSTDHLTDTITEAGIQ